MKYKLFILLGLLILESCASILSTRRQKVTINTGNEKATVFINDKKVGEGVVVKTKLKKNFRTKQIKVEAPGFVSQYYAAAQVNKSPLRYLSFIPLIALISEPFIIRAIDPSSAGEHGELVLLLPVSAGVAALDVFTKSINYEDHFNAPLIYKEKLRSENEKYIYSIGLSFGQEYPISYYEVKYKDYKKKFKKIIFEKSQKSFKENLYKPVLYYQVKQEANSFFFKNELDSVITNSRFINDSVNELSDNYRSVVKVNCAINNINYYNIYKPNLLINMFPNNFIFAGSSITWQIRNKYNELIKTLTIESESGQFSSDFYTIYNDTLQRKLVNSILLNSFNKLMMDSSVSAIFNIKNESQNSLATTTFINKTDSIVNSINDAKVASVIIKTKNSQESGFVISNDGFIITNYHAVAGDSTGKPTDPVIITSEGERFRAKVISYNMDQNLALLKVEKKFDKCFMLPTGKNYKIGNSVYSISSPVSIELGQSIGKGIISNDKVSDTNILIQLNMNINPGDDGCGIFNENDHKLIGVANFILAGSNTEGTASCIPAYKISEYLNITIK